MYRQLHSRTTQIPYAVLKGAAHFVGFDADASASLRTDLRSCLRFSPDIARSAFTKRFFLYRCQGESLDGNAGATETRRAASGNVTRYRRHRFERRSRTLNDYIEQIKVKRAGIAMQ